MNGTSLKTKKFWPLFNKETNNSITVILEQEQKNNQNKELED